MSDDYQETYDYGKQPYALNVSGCARYNQNYRCAVWSGTYLQMTLMCIPICDDIGLEIHADTDQMIRIEDGFAMAKMGYNKASLECQWTLSQGDVIFVPAGVWHNVINIGDCPLKLSTIYAPPHHPLGTIHPSKYDAMHE